MNTQIRPKLSEPVARSLIASGTDLLAELSEETLVGVTASVTVSAPCGSITVTCAYSGDDA